MGQVRDIMEKNVITIDINETANNAANQMKENDISFLVIIKNGKPVGVVSERDFVQKLCINNQNSSDVKISDIMSYKFRWVNPTTKIEDAIQKMLNNNIRRLLVLDDEKLVGVITQTDLASYLREKLMIDGTIKNIKK
ncbi:MAG TPA: CBS domain-containing protein [Candidatus Nitrosopelagicus sp.]|jgi:CBS domain-containing protein|nr:CBS domain-containing protein [Candidatus Nitrosopelagicus sp.]HJN19612.1 CBS domain-containing protein [Candidatus Nitrosopelagicus sp.]|tara:strand:- start:89 stop:502 length:414 start_codon:yes stop_codon:yes gene_type:complete